MSIINLEFDNTLTKSEIIMPLMSSSRAQAGENFPDNNYTDKMQTSVFGIQTPLIMINTVVISFDAIHSFNLSSTGSLPSLSMSVEDKYELINNIDKPSMDNEVRIQIIPRFDNAYKKINLTFFISDIEVNGKYINLTCIYKLPKLTSSNFKTFGEIDTYNLFKTIATDTGLGFASNLAELTDKRFIYCNNKSYLNLMNSEITMADNSNHVLDWWIDLWDNVNIVDIKERYEAIDSNEDMMIWVAGQVNEVTADVETVPSKVVASINNLPMYNNSELYVKEYTINSNPGSSLGSGTDKVYSIYNAETKEYMDYLVQDGDIKEDIFLMYEYVGENYCSYNYMLSKRLRDTYLQKINSETIKVTLQSPLLGLMRGHRVNFIRYVNDDKIENKLVSLEEAGIIDRNVESNIPLTDYEMDKTTNAASYKIDKTTSGQYLIIGVEIIYDDKGWSYILDLAKPASSKTTILNK